MVTTPPALGLLLDVDGPIASPVTRTVPAPIIRDLIILAGAGVPIAFITGRSLAFMRDEVVADLVATGLSESAACTGSARRGRSGFRSRPPASARSRWTLRSASRAQPSKPCARWSARLRRTPCSSTRPSRPWSRSSSARMSPTSATGRPGRLQRGRILAVRRPRDRRAVRGDGVTGCRRQGSVPHRADDHLHRHRVGAAWTRTGPPSGRSTSSPGTARSRCCGARWATPGVTT